MAAVTAASSATATQTGATSTVSGKAMDATQDRFLKLLSAQLMNQDPLNPMDNAQVTSQIAQINTVNGVEKLNQTMATMAQQFSAMQTMQGAMLVGRQVMVDGNQVVAQNGVAQGMVTLDANAASLKVDVLDRSGNVVDTIPLGSNNAGEVPFSWTPSASMDTTGMTFRVTASNNGQAVTNTLSVQAKVKSASPTATGLTLELQGLGDVPFSKISSVLGS